MAEFFNDGDFDWTEAEFVTCSKGKFIAWNVSVLYDVADFYHKS
jgi:hypothetical protein